jgi:hypothetical protein
MAKDVQKIISVRPAYQVSKGAVKQESTLGVQYSATAVFDTAGLDSAGVSNKTIAAHGLGVFLPTKAIIVRASFQTVTGFTSAANTATIALSAQTANDLKTATLVSDAVYVAAGYNDGVPAHSATTGIVLTAQRELVATVAVQALTAGKLVLYIEYIIGA